MRLGDRVRVTLPRLPARTQPRSFTGTLVALQPPVLTLATGRDSVTVSLDSVLTFEVSRGRESRERTTAIVGAAAGLALGFVVSQIRHPVHDPPPREIVAVTLLGGFVGTGLGVAIGMQMKGDRWEVVPVPGRS